MSDPVYATRDGAVATVYLNQPAKKNAISAKMMDALATIMRELDADPEIKAVVLRGTGENFSSGGDLAQDEPGADTVEGKVGMLQRYLTAVKTIREIGKPVIAAADGYVVGGGFSLLLACDLAVVSDRVKVVPAFVSIGIVPEMGMMKLLPELVGEKTAKEILFLGKRLGADDLLRLGIANRVFPAAEFEAATLAFASELAAQPGASVQFTKRIMNATADVGLEQLLRAEVVTSPMCTLTADFAAVAKKFAK
ncbi:MAG: enoyl-CoA hydratase/isomerase family protein [Propionibacteriaceae bacterium]|jgi:2-(1,2-epoxy-1,2-dihydrophenyl)acetyl-CoA isomerase|nr:enoyl-CoA hydratase/isomerase family protein [Propionibacteriaceae bacterium]